LGAQIVACLHAYARGDEERSVKEIEVCDLSDLAREAIEMSGPRLRERSAQKGMHIRIETELARSCTVLGHKRHLRDVALNLIKNSIEALPEGGEITIDTWVKDGESVLRIADTGKGIPEENISRLFTPFFTTHAEVGRGLGPANAQRIVAAHQGTITAESREGEGTVFTVAFPYAPPPT
jgi:signal transduction histidine kinase